MGGSPLLRAPNGRLIRTASGHLARKKDILYVTVVGGLFVDEETAYYYDHGSEEIFGDTTFVVVGGLFPTTKPDRYYFNDEEYDALSISSEKAMELDPGNTAYVDMIFRYGLYGNPIGHIRFKSVTGTFGTYVHYYSWYGGMSMVNTVTSVVVSATKPEPEEA